MSEHLTLKWGSLKSWHIESEKGRAALERYFAEGVCMSAALQHDTDTQKDAICDLIDAVDCGEIFNDWSGETMTKDEAKRYVREYGRGK
jgi:hypothetical protein